MYFDKAFFAKVLDLAKGDRTKQQFSDDSGVSRPYISMLLNLKREEPPTPDILKKLEPYTTTCPADGWDIYCVLGVYSHVSLI